MCSFRSQDAEKIWDLLLAAGADINARDRNGHTIFWHQIAQAPRSKHGEDGGPRDDVRFLLDHGASPHMRDLRGRTCLHEAIKKQPTTSSDSKDTPRLDSLLGIGLDHTLCDHNGNSLLHELAARERDRDGYGRKWVLPLWERLVCTLGLDVNQQNVSFPHYTNLTASINEGEVGALLRQEPVSIAYGPHAASHHL
jgi:hypothetical protein